MTNTDSFALASAIGFVSVILNVVFTSTSILAVVLSEDGNKIKYSITGAVLLSEFFKAILSWTAVIISNLTGGKTETAPRLSDEEDDENTRLRPTEAKNDMMHHFKNSLPLLIPTVLYALGNNLTYVVLLLLDAPTYKLTQNIRIVLTAILFVVILRRKLSTIQYLCLIILTCSLTLSKYEDIACGGSYGNGGKENLGSTTTLLTGLAIMFIIQLTTSFANVYTELRFKKQFFTSIHLQNAFLYSYGVIVNLLVYIVQELALSGGFDQKFRLFQGMNVFAWLAILSNSVSGIVISFVLKYSDNIMHTFASALSMVVVSTTVTVLTMLGVFDGNSGQKYVMTASFAIGSVATFSSILIYSLEAAKSKKTLKDYVDAVAINHRRTEDDLEENDSAESVKSSGAESPQTPKPFAKYAVLTSQDETENKEAIQLSDDQNSHTLDIELEEEASTPNAAVEPAASASNDAESKSTKEKSN